MPGAIPATERVEIAAFAAMFEAATPDVGRRLGLSARRVGRGYAFCCGALPAIELNRALGIHTVEELGAAERFFRRAGSVFWVSPLPGSGLEPELERRGYEAGYRWMKFSREAGGPPDYRTDLQIAFVGAERALDFAVTACTAYGFPEALVPWLAALPGRPGWSCAVSYDHGRPVGSGALFVDGDAGWLGIAATLPQARGRGSQTAILATRIARGAELGCSVVVTETGERVTDRPSGSYRNIVRAGFAERYLRANYRAPAP